MTADLFNSELRELIYLIRDIPFAFTPNLCIRSMLRFGGGSCSPKHALLLKVLDSYNIASRLVYVKLEYDDGAFPVPDELAFRQPGDLYGHTSLQIQVDNGWQFLDISFDRFLHPRFQVNHDLLLTDCSISEVVDLSVVTGEPSREERRVALGLQDPAPQDLAKVRRRIKEINMWMVSLRRDHFTEIYSEKMKRETMLHKFLDTKPAFDSLEDVK